MFIKSNIIFLFLLEIQNVFLIQLSNNNIIFEIADLTTDYDTGEGMVNIEAFKSSINEMILNKNEKKKYGQLNWLSIGYPKLALFPDKKMFSFRPEGFDILVDMLNDDHRQFLKKLVKRKYKIDITTDQIVSLILSKFECIVEFVTDDEKLYLKGSVKHFNKFPLKVFFPAPEKSKERIEFDKRVKNDKDKLDLDFKCHVSANGQTIKKNTLLITGDQIDQLGLIDNIFGPADSVFVTRNQISKLTSELYVKLNIIEEYEIPEHEFSSKFLDDFIKQTSTFISKQIPFEEALASLSRYDLRKDLQPNLIKEELQKVFKIDRSDSKSNLVVDRTWYEHLKTKSSTDISTSLDVNVFEIADINGSVDYVGKNSRNWQKSGSSFDQQLKELNNFQQNDIEWVRKGEIIEPKSIKVSRLSKAAFKKSLVFNRIRREVYDAPFNRDFVLSTSNNIYAPNVVKENSERIQNIEKNIKKSKKELSNLSSTYTSQVAEIDEKLKTNKNELNSINSRSINLKQEISNRPTSCRLCFQETENGSGKCTGSRNSCTTYTGPSQGVSWTAPFRHDSGLKPNHRESANGGCTYQWSIQCNYS